MIDCVVAPFDHTLLVTDEEVRTTDPPEQNVVAPPAVIEAVAGIGFTVTFVTADAAEVHPPAVVCTLNAPEALTVIDCVVAPFDQRLPEAAEDVRTTLPPAQKVNGPPAEIVGTAGVGLTVTGILFEAAEEQPFVVTTTE